jgi:2-dehydro-3-deoxyphosphogluconate aldolase / (4S)-4-hydroxy-2-oxoglutarate aldolase
MTAKLAAEDVMRLAPVIPVLTVAHVDHAAPLAAALVDGGLLALEVTLRTADGLAAIRAMTKARPDAVVGAGTVLNADALKRAVDAGARFIVSPGLTKPLARAAEAAGVPLLAGVATASDIMRGLDLGLKRFKFFPAETSGGAPAIAAFAGPFGDIAFCPTGGITLDSAPRYLGMKNVFCVGGTWVAPKDAVEAGDWARITELSKGAAALTRAALA